MIETFKKGLFLGKRQALAALYFGVFAGFSLNSNIAHGQTHDDWQDHQQLYQFASEFIQRSTGQQASINPLHRNNRIPACLTDIKVDFPFNNHKTIRLHCDKTASQQKPNWSLHLKVTIATSLQAWQLVTQIAAGELIKSTDISLETFQGHDFGQYVSADQSPAGRYSKHTLKPGHWLKKDDLSNSIMVWQTKQLVPAESVITKDMLASKKVNSRQASVNAISDINAIIGKTSRRSLAAGHIINSNNLTGRQQVLVASQNLPPKRPIVATDLRLEWRLDTQLRQAAYNEKSLIVGKVPRSYIAAGRVITENLLRTAYLVGKGEQVKLIYKTANLSISSDATALADGNLGDIIKVEVMGSKKVKQGKVVDKRRVELVE